MIVSFSGFFDNSLQNMKDPFYQDQIKTKVSIFGMCKNYFFSLRSG